MAYSTKFRARARSIGGADIELLIEKNNYSGPIIDRPFGQTPVLKVDGDVVMSTSIEFALECQQNDELVELYTSAATDYRVRYYYGGSLVFSGFVTPELYAASWVDPPYDVKIVASDNLAELKGNTWANEGRIPLSAAMETLMAATGAGFSLYWCSSLSAGTATAAGTPASLFVCLKKFKGESYYDVLTGLMKGLHARIVQLSGRWCVFRETDLSGMISGGWLKSNTSTNMCRVLDFGSARTHSFWPVNNMTMEISPAHCSQRLNFSPAWETTTMSRSEGQSTTTFSKDMSMTELNWFPATKVRIRLSSSAEITQYLQIGFRNPNGYFLALTQAWPYIGPTPTDVFHTYEIAPGDDRVLDIELPGYMIANTSYRPNTLEVIIENKSSITIDSVTIECIDTWDLTQDVRLLNGARTPADEIDLALFDVDYGWEQAWISNAWSRATLWNVNFQSAAIPAGEPYRYFIARDYAFSHANPRLVLKGVISSFDNPSPYSLIWSNRGINYLAKTLSWDAYNEETDVELISLPASALEIDEITLTKEPRK